MKKVKPNFRNVDALLSDLNQCMGRPCFISSPTSEMEMLYLNQCMGRAMAMLCLSSERYCKGKGKSHEDCMSRFIWQQCCVYPTLVTVGREREAAFALSDISLSEIALSQCFFILDCFISVLLYL